MLSIHKLDAAKSVVRNIAEGAGRWAKADKAKHYAIARGEAMECASSVDLMRAEALIDDERYARALELLERVVSLLTGLMKKPM
jgi:four helix bundle protein